MWIKGINFRSTARYVVDAASETYSIGELYPIRRNGVTFGWDAAPGAVGDRTGFIESRTAGVAQANTATVRNFRIDLPTPGFYEIDMYLGDAQFSNQHVGTLFDDSNPLFFYNGAAGSAGDSMDAAGQIWTSFASSTLAQQGWASSKHTRVFYFSTTKLVFQLGSLTSVGNCTLGYLKVSQFLTPLLSDSKSEAEPLWRKYGRFLSVPSTAPTTRVFGYIMG